MSWRDEVDELLADWESTEAGSDMDEDEQELTGDEWEAHMYRMMDATPPDQALKRTAFSAAAVSSAARRAVASSRTSRSSPSCLV